MTDNTTTLTEPVLTKTSQTTVKLSKGSLTKDKEDGLTNPEMAKKYNLPLSQISKALKMVGLANKKPVRKNKFEIVED